jgi:hypothetical protein
LTGIDVVHLWQEFALGNVASSVTRTHMTKRALWIHAEGVATRGSSGFMSKRVQLKLIKHLRMIPLATGAIVAVTFEVEIVAEL